MSSGGADCRMRIADCRMRPPKSEIANGRRCDPLQNRVRWKPQVPRLTEFDFMRRLPQVGDHERPEMKEDDVS